MSSKQAGMRTSANAASRRLGKRWRTDTGKEAAV